MRDLRWPTYTPRDLVLEAAEPSACGGALHVRDREGRLYLDAVGGIGCTPLGHGHPLWVEAITTQIARLTAAANIYHTRVQQQLAARLVELFPVAEARVFLCNTGAEATEAALKLALRATGRDVVIAFEGAFHGRTLGAIALTANPDYRTPYVTCLDEDHVGRFASVNVVRVPFCDLDRVARAMEEHPGRVAAVFVEPIQGQSGVRPATREFLVGLRQLCSNHGALLCVDEIQCGSGRTGRFAAWSSIVGDDPAFFPDVLWLAKALGGGFPIGACLARRSLAEAMTSGSHGTTFGGNPVACAAALATMRILEEEGLLDRAAQQLPTLQEIARDDPEPRVEKIRGLGAMIGIEIRGARETLGHALGRGLQEQGLLATIPGGRTVRLLLPYHAGRGELQEAWSALRRALANLA